MWQAHAITDNGGRSSNEDAYLVRDDIGLWVVADGMGGHEAGELASEAMVNALWNVPGSHNIEQMLERIVVTAESVNRSLQAKLQRLPSEQKLGTTLAALLISGSEGACVWAGDSRVYRLHEGKLQQLTRDHSVVQDLIDQGTVHPKQAKNHPHANVITRAIGVDEQIELDVKRFRVSPEDKFIICSDGLTNEVMDNELQALLNVAEANQAAEQLLRLALSRDARDNTTIVVVGKT